MKKEIISFVLVLVLVFGISFVFALSSDSYAISSYDVSSGGGDSSSDSYATDVIIGGVSGDSSSDSYATDVGFISTIGSGTGSCLDLNSCSENGNCTLNSSCVLRNDLCSDSICNFEDLTISSSVRTGHDASGNGNNLTLVLTGDLLFLSGNKINLSGENGVQGGNGGNLNITRYNGLINTSAGKVYASGGDSSGGGNDGGNGGNIYLYYWGIVGLFDLQGASYSVDAGANGEGGNIGSAGDIYQDRDDETLVNGLRDVDINDDGAVTIADVFQIGRYYNSVTGEVGYTSQRDINVDEKLNVIDTSKIGRQYETRE